MIEQRTDRYAELTARLSTTTGVGAASITALTVATIWGQWRPIAWIAAVQVLVIGFNMWVNMAYLPRVGRRAEVVRTGVNLAATLLIARLAGWPLPVWLWLPYVALTFDHLEPRIALGVLVCFCVVQDTVALLDGASPIYPLVFTLFAAYCSELSRLRHGIIRDMLVRSDRQRHEIESAQAARQLAERELQQAQKLEAIGRLAAGVAHEINTPVQYVSDNVQFLRDSTRQLFGLVGELQTVQRAALAGEDAAGAARRAAAAEESTDLPYLQANIPSACDGALDGLGRVATIIRSLKEYAHPDPADMRAVDLNHALATTLTLARNEYKYIADLDAAYGDLPPVVCHGGEINQAILNIVVNAAHAIADVVKGTDRRGGISVRTRRDGDHAVISIADTGGGIPETIRPRIFDPFFTTKEVGRGTGQGLSIARAIVVDRHHGELTFESTPGSGTTFYIRLPLTSSAAAATADHAA